MTGSPAVRKTAVLAIILASYLMIVLDISIVITALPALALVVTAIVRARQTVETVETVDVVAAGPPVPATPTRIGAEVRR